MRAQGLAAVIPIGPSESTPERRASLRRASVKAVRDKLTEQSRVSTKTWIYIGKELAGVKRAAKADGQKAFPSLFARNADERKDESKYPFSRRTADQLIAVSERFGSMDPNGLPSSWRTLYVLSRIEPKRLEKLIASGGVHPMMTRAEAQRFAAQPKKARRQKDVGFRTAKRWFLGIEDTSIRARRLAALIRECGVSIEEIRREI